MKYTDLMIDIETLGRTPGVAVIQIAAVPFNINTGEVSTNTFRMSIGKGPQIKAGYQWDVNTIKWWEKENPKLFKKLSNSKNHYVKVAVEFQKWFRSLPDNQNIRVWGNSNRFDLGIIEGWYAKSIGHKFQPFWNTWLENDCRTLSNLKPEIKRNLKFIGTKHDAIDDCKHQIKYCHQTIKSLKIKL